MNNNNLTNNNENLIFMMGFLIGFYFCFYMTNPRNNLIN
jgi:hypothetical protein